VRRIYYFLIADPTLVKTWTSDHKKYWKVRTALETKKKHVYT